MVRFNNNSNIQKVENRQEKTQAKAAWFNIYFYADRSLDFEDSDFDDDEVKDDLISGVQDSLRALFSMGISEMDPHQKPSVTVVEGGRSADQPPTEKAPPKLRVADSGDENSGGIDDSEQDFDGHSAFDNSNVSFHLIKPQHKKSFLAQASFVLRSPQETDFVSLLFGHVDALSSLTQSTTRFVPCSLF